MTKDTTHPNEPEDSFGAHVLDGVLGKIGDREFGPGHVVLSEERYQWFRQVAGLLDDDEDGSFDESLDDEDEGGFDECGMTPSGQCTLAGSEHCDWICKVRGF